MNHDEDMLRDGPYTWPLKRRISGGLGHLSNVAVGRGDPPLRGPERLAASSPPTSRAPTTRVELVRAVLGAGDRALRLGRPVRDRGPDQGPGGIRGMKVQEELYESGSPGLSPRAACCDPQGKAIAAALARLGHRSVRDVRAGKVFFIDVDGQRSARRRGRRSQDGRGAPREHRHRGFRREGRGGGTDLV